MRIDTGATRRAVRAAEVPNPTAKHAKITVIDVLSALRAVLSFHIELVQSDPATEGDAGKTTRSHQAIAKFMIFDAAFRDASLLVARKAKAATEETSFAFVFHLRILWDLRGLLHAVPAVVYDSRQLRSGLRRNHCTDIWICFHSDHLHVGRLGHTDSLWHRCHRSGLLLRSHILTGVHYK